MTITTSNFLLESTIASNWDTMRMVDYAFPQSVNSTCLGALPPAPIRHQEYDSHIFEMGTANNKAPSPSYRYIAPYILRPQNKVHSTILVDITRTDGMHSRLPFFTASNQPIDRRS